MTLVWFTFRSTTQGRSRGSATVGKGNRGKDRGKCNNRGVRKGIFWSHKPDFQNMEPTPVGKFSFLSRNPLPTQTLPPIIFHPARTPAQIILSFDGLETLVESSSCTKHPLLFCSLHLFAFPDSLCLPLLLYICSASSVFQLTPYFVSCHYCYFWVTDSLFPTSVLFQSFWRHKRWYITADLIFHSLYI